MALAAPAFSFMRVAHSIRLSIRLERQTVALIVFDGTQDVL